MSQEEYDYDYDDFANDDDIVDHGPYLNLDGDDPKWTPYPPENDPYEMMDAYKAQAEKEAKGKWIRWWLECHIYLLFDYVYFVYS